MTDYSSWKVTDLKAELKRRGIPQTGLRVKQNFIDRLLQADSTGPPEPSTEVPPFSPPPEEHAQEPKEPVESTQDVSVNEQKPSSVPDLVPEKSGPEGQATAEAPEPASRGPTEEILMKDEVEGVKVGHEVEIAQGSSLEAKEPGQEPEIQNPAQFQESVTEPAETETAAAVSATPQEPELVIKALSEEKTDSKKQSVEDSRKRKRRSQSPPPSPKTSSLKKAKAEDGFPRAVLGEDVQAEKPVASEEITPPEDAKIQGVGPEVSEGLEEQKAAPQPEPATHKEGNEATEPATVTQGEPDADKTEEQHVSKQVAGDARFKGLFPVVNGGQPRSSSPKALAGEEDEDRVVSPALHPATTSLYIRNFMRPLQPTVLKKHLASLATPPTSSVDPDIVLDFFLDSIKTHCFVTFKNVSAASRVRSALHGTIWPDERTRKPLWVDFIPEEKVKEWIGIEQDSGSGARGAPRWEVVYDEAEEGITASLQEVGPANQVPALHHRDPAQNLGREPPLGPRATHGPMFRDSKAAAPPAVPTRYAGEGFKALDDRFLSTAAKPKLYYQPVPLEVSEKRLDRFADLYRAGPKPRRGTDEMRKYTFEDTDFFVDKGPEYGSRGRRRGGRGARFRDRGDFRDSWRR
ncbi:SAP domain-containing protein [Paracoccidioides lutzii Pb01]|uniref:SAP domain-containing protein n=1 Tax=Paracoccidioides lutzii (strain ATCC MYA-826 / Pb01) TaxID=502779 RepID=C1H1Z0_PARBA|nr:SAP domain-containing protein [Paracoccidioides lutzii Pb01]EEH33877.1 SAP domain-containing protein [Paracoccidioides lutzii Pb01]